MQLPVPPQHARLARLLPHLARWLVTMKRYDRDRVPPGLGPKFISARQAAGLIPDGATVISTGLAGHQRCTAMYFAIRDRFAETQHPRDLTWVSVGAIGGRGKSPGTLEELGAPGLATAYITGHHETIKTFLAGAQRGEKELHTMPQGELAFLIEGQARGELSHVTDVGVGTFLDPRVGTGSAVTPSASRALIEATEDGRLRYSLPRLEVAVISAPYADAAGNIYARGAAAVTEIHDAAAAVHANGGTVIVTVGGVIEPRDREEPHVPTDLVDHIVVNHYNEQTFTVPTDHSWPMFTEPGPGRPEVDEREALGDIRFINNLLGITPRRTAADGMLARLGAAVTAERLRRGDIVNIGVGLPEEVGRVLHDRGLSDGITQTSETGVWGGTPASGVFFGAAVNPERIERSAWVFHKYEERLDLAVLGMLEVDSAGNVNVSKRGDEVEDYVGPGGFTNIAHHAKVIVFVGSMAAHSRLRIEDGRLVVERAGVSKLVEQVREVTFSGPMALERGQEVWYATHLALFQLTERGLELRMVAPGVDVERDVVGPSVARVVLPDGGAAAVGVYPEAVMTGRGFRLGFGEATLGL